MSEGGAQGAALRRRPAAADVAWIGLALGALVLVAALLWLAPALEGLSPDPSYPFFSVWQSAVQPEPLESVRWLLALAAPFALAGLVLVLGSRSPAEHRFDGALIAVQVIGIALVVWAVLEQESGPYFPEPADYFEPLLLSTPVLVAGVLIGAGLCWLLISGRGRFDRLLGGRSPSSPGAAAWIVAVVVTILWLLPAVVTDANVASSGSIASSHIPAWADDYFAVINGRVPLVDYGAQYAQLLPLVVAPAIDALGNSLVAFSAVATALSVLALSALYGVLGQVTRRPWVAVALYVPVVAISLVPWSALGPRSEFSGDYFGFFPGRYLLPFVLAWLCAVHVRRARPGAAVLFFVGGLAVLNNFEFGTAALIALAVALSLASPRSPLRALWALVPRALLGLAAALLTVSGVTLISAGELPDLGLLTHFTRIFVSESFGLVPMPTLGLHIPIYLTFVAALLLAAVRHVQGRDDRALTAMLAYAGVFGLLAGSYFAGRSLPWQLILLFPIWGFAVALLSWAAVPGLRSLAAARRRGERFPRSLPAALATILAFGVMVAAIATAPLPWPQVERLTEDGPHVNDVPEVEAFVADRTTPGEAILLFGPPSEHRVAERADTENASPWNSAISLFSADEVDLALDQLDAEEGSKVFLWPSGPLIGELLADDGPVAGVLAERGFEPAEADPQSGVTLWQRSAG